MDDRAVVERQLGRAPRAFRRVVLRCPFGAPAVTEQAPYGAGRHGAFRAVPLASPSGPPPATEQPPYDAAGEPFPTTYYLTCRHLVAAVSRLEAAGGIERGGGASGGGGG